MTKFLKCSTCSGQITSQWKRKDWGVSGTPQWPGESGSSPSPREGEQGQGRAEERPKWQRHPGPAGQPPAPPPGPRHPGPAGGPGFSPGSSIILPAAPGGCLARSGPPVPLHSAVSLPRANRWDFLGGPVVESPLANARDTGSTPGPGRSHVLRGNKARV